MKEILDWLYSQRRFSKKVGLERTFNLLKEMDNPQNSFQSIIVGGTNGKGSTSSNLASILKQSGLKVGFFSSPHLSYFSERYLVDGKRLDNQEIKDALLYIKPLALKTDTTFFEISMALACKLFADNNVNYAIMEVGVGGTNDATNVLEPVQSIITNIALEHTNVLGKTLTEIANKKAGIMRKNTTSFTAASGEGLLALQKQAKAKQAELVVLQDYKIELLKSDWQSSKFKLTGFDIALELETPLLGNYQLKNASLAALAAKELFIFDDDIKKGIKNTIWPARLERISYKERNFILDGAHNPAAIKELIISLKDLKTTNLLLIFGSMKSKDIGAMLEPLAEISKEYIFTQSTSYRAMPAQELKKLTKVKSRYRTLVKDAVELAIKSTKPNEKILVVGSLYLMGEVRPLII